jgi:transcriptional regulator with XRE-family HTH domain
VYDSGTNARAILAKNMRKLRKETGLSQEDLAEKADLHRTFIGSVERGERNISIDNIEKIARALDVPISVLVSEEI